MIDLHAHLVYGFDDGAADRDCCSRMLEIYAEHGVDTVCATSHSAADVDHRYQDCFSATEELAKGFGVKLLPGMEYALPDLLNDPSRPLGEGRYFLLDTAMFPIDPALFNKLMPLVGDSHSILWAHPERLHTKFPVETAKKYAILRGSACQLNASSLLGRYGKEPREAGWKLLSGGFCAVIASDAHHPEAVTNFVRAARLLGELYPPELRDVWFTVNPSRILAGKFPERPDIPKLGWISRLKAHFLG